MKPCCVNFFINKEPDFFVKNVKSYNIFLTNLGLHAKKFIFYTEIDTITDATFNTIIPNYEVHIINDTINLKDIYKNSKSIGECSVFMTDIMEYISSKNTFLSKSLYYIKCEQSDSRLLRLFYISNKDESLNINDINIYEIHNSNLVSDATCKNLNNDRFIVDYLKNDISYIHNLLVKKSYNEIILSENTQASWIRYFSLIISHFNNMNYKACLENCQYANKIRNNNLEVDYYTAKIYFDNNNAKKTLNILSNYLDTIPENNSYCFDKTLYFKIYELIILTLSKLGEKYQGIDLINWLVRKRVNIRNQFIILSAFLSNFECIKKTCIPEIDNYKFTYTIREKHLIFNRQIVKFITQKDKLIIHTADNENTIDIININTHNSAYLNHNNKNILQIQLEQNELKISRLDLEKKEIISFMKHNIEEYWNDYILETNFIELNSYYCSIVRHRDCKYNLLNLLLIEKKSLRPVLITNFIKIINNKIHDFIIQNDKIFLICEYQNNIVTYILDEQQLYLNYNLPFNYKESINLNIEKQSIKIITNPPNIIDNIKLDMYLLSEKSTNIINLDYQNSILSRGNYNEYITDFMYKFEKLSIEKTSTISFFNKETCNELFTELESLHVDIGDVYEFSKYLVINMHELNSLTSNDISNIINSNTLIINLIEEDEIESPCSKIIENEYLNKLFLFNIVKNSDYIKFIYEKIIEDDQYDQRSNFIEIDKKNINNLCGISRYVKSFFEGSKSSDLRYENDYKKYPYKLELITNLHKKTDNLILIEILRYIIYNNQNVTLLHNISINELIIKLNVLGNLIRLDKLENVPIQGKYLLLIDTYNTLREMKPCCGSGTMIYVNEANKILYVS